MLVYIFIVRYFSGNYKRFAEKKPVKTLGIAVNDQFLCFLCDFSQLLRLF